MFLREFERYLCMCVCVSAESEGGKRREVILDEIGAWKYEFHAWISNE